ncbi:MAG: hypothetical protein EPO47_02570 [Rugosibacter sp.]|nr:MAG: hypothetical protein EPO60_06520 [Rugosibacter sp.]TBR11107.1 MAG: hypothetical protein EPO47_02570 [Rugosibacter sp.]
MKSLRTLVRAVIGVIFPVMALAQSGSQPARPDPADATASVPPLHYESALDTYRPMDDQPTPDKAWRSANDLVRDTGSMSSMSMDDESGDMQNMDQGAMKNMKGMQMDGMDMKQSKPDSSKPAKQKAPTKHDGMPGMDMSTKHGKEMP